MKTKLLVVFSLITGLGLHLTSAAPLGTAFTFQGRLTAGGVPANGTFELRFTLHDAASGGLVLAGPLTNSPILVTNGLFTVPLDFGASAFAGEARWLEIGVRTNGAAGAFTVLSPRQWLTPSPHALYAPSAGAAGTLANNAVVAGGVTFSPAAGPPFAVSSTNRVVQLNADLLDGLDSAQFWKLRGNSNTIPGTHYLGTADNQALELKVNGQRALRLVPNTNNSPTIIAGHPLNEVAPGTPGATISGGRENSVTNGADYSTIGGGIYNTIGSLASLATIAGGYRNTIEYDAYQSVIGGGLGNIIHTQAWASVIGGGEYNEIHRLAQMAVLSGGYSNRIGEWGLFAAIPGGTLNEASGVASLAAGYRAKALSDGCFVWGDSTEADFTTTAQDQFLIRAANGVGINTNRPVSALHVRGTVTADGYVGNGAGLAGLNAGQLASGTIPEARLPANVARLDASQTFAGVNVFSSSVGIGQPSPAWPLDVRASHAGVRFTTLNNDYGSILELQNVGEMSGTLGAINFNNVANTYPGQIAYLSANGMTFRTGGAERMRIDTAGNLGLGTTVPQARLDVAPAAGVRGLQVVGQRTGDWSSALTWLENVNNTGNSAPALRIATWGACPNGALSVSANGTGLIAQFGNYYSFVANITTNGTFNGLVFNPSSDRDAKEQFTAVEPRQILDKVVALPLSEWSYKADAPTRHLGPVAQDFRAAFGLGADDKHIATVDADGVALAAIQGLNQKVESRSQESEARSQKLEAKSQELEAENAALKKELGELKALVTALAEKVNRGVR
jgi:trimeric autotransporter adhesin